LPSAAFDKTSTLQPPGGVRDAWSLHTQHFGKQGLSDRKRVIVAAVSRAVVTYSRCQKDESRRKFLCVNAGVVNADREAGCASRDCSDMCSDDLRSIFLRLFAFGTEQRMPGDTFGIARHVVTDRNERGTVGASVNHQDSATESSEIDCGGKTG
jgi:hypothetical protein